VAVHLSLAPEWTAPFVIVRASGVCHRVHGLPWAVLFDVCADMPAYVPSNAVVGIAGWAATGIASASAVAIARSGPGDVNPHYFHVREKPMSPGIPPGYSRTSAFRPKPSGRRRSCQNS